MSNVVYELLQQYEPEIVITHTLGGEKLDHEGTAYMVYLAFKKAMTTIFLWVNYG